VVLRERAGGAGDEKTAARIRDAAIDRFGRDGFGVGLRAIASAAGVTAGLVVHYFGSKDGLRAACDAHVQATVREAKEKALVDGSATAMVAQLAAVDEFAPLVRYLLRSLQSGGVLATGLLEQMIANAEQYLATGEAAGVVRPSRDPAARTRYLAYQAAGGLLLWFALHGDISDDDEFRAMLRRYVDETILPGLEVFSQGLFVDRSMLDEFLAAMPDPPPAEPS